MEHAQRDYDMVENEGIVCVLILILMEHAQRGYIHPCNRKAAECLNPYFNGTCSKSACLGESIKLSQDSLNPYFNGTCSKRLRVRKMSMQTNTCLNPYFNGTCSKRLKQFVAYCKRHNMS